MTRLKHDSEEPDSADRSAEPRFVVGDLAVVPPHGVAEVVGISTEEIGGSAATFYDLYVRQGDLRMLVPAAKLGRVGLRQLIGPHEAPAVLAVLGKKRRGPRGPWVKQLKELMAKVGSGSVYAAAEVARDLTTMKGRRPLSARLTHWRDCARELVIRELASATGRSEAELASEVDAILASLRR